MTEKLKATKRLSNFNFEGEGSAVALVGKAQGGAANGFTTLLTKATNKITQEDVEKASKVTVTMNIVDYLQTFFNLWWEDAEVLARVMGYDTSPDEQDDTPDWYERWIESQVEAVTIMKSLVIDKEEAEVHKAVAELSPQDYLKIIKSQEIFEKNLEAVKKSSNKSSVKPEGVTEPKGSISPSVDLEKSKEDLMSAEIISKAAHLSAVQEAVEKAVAPVKAELEKAQNKIKEYEDEKVAAVSKARKAQIAEVEKDEGKAEELFKSLETLPEAAFESVIKALKGKEEKVEKSDLLKEIGSEGREAVTEEVEDKTLAILKAKYQNKEGAK